MGTSNTLIVEAANADGLDSDLMCEPVSGEVRRNTAFRIIDWFEHMQTYPSQLRGCDRRLYEAIQVDEKDLREMAGLND